MHTFCSINLYFVFKILMLKNDVDLLQIKSKIQENTINIMKREIEDLNLEHANEIEQMKKELSNNLNLMYHYKGNLFLLL